MKDEDTTRGLSRRGFLSTGAIPVAASVLTDVVQAQAQTRTAASASGTIPITLQVNGQARAVSVDVRTTLLDVLRERIGLTGSKKGCDHGQCGACTMHIDGRSALGCLTLAVSAQGRAITTIEGLIRGATLHPMQQAFVNHDAFQCGYCTPGQIMSAVACVNEGRADSDDAIREAMSGNLCRCAAYPNIVAAVRDARGRMPAPSRRP